MAIASVVLISCADGCVTNANGLAEVSLAHSPPLNSRPERITADGLRSYKAEMRMCGNTDQQEVGCGAERAVQPCRQQK